MDLNVFTPPVLRGIRLRMVVELLGMEILRYVVLGCCEETIEEIAVKCQNNNLQRKNPATATGKLISIGIDKTGIDAAKDKTGKSFDITFLFKITLIIQYDHPDLFTYAKKIKDKRNEVFHNKPYTTQQEFDSDLADLETLFKDTLDKAEAVADTLSGSCSDSKLIEISDAKSLITEKKKNITSEINRIKTEKIEETITNVLEYLKTVGQEEVNKYLKKLTYLDPVEFFLGIDYKFSVSDLYTEQEFVDSKTSERVGTIIDLMNEVSANIIIEGPAGSGKSTFFRYLISEKMSENLLTDSFCILFNCRDHRFKNLREFIFDLMPNSSYVFTKQALLAALKELKPTFIIDGLDELNKNSEAVLEEIISLSKRDEARFIASSRPESVEIFLSRIIDVQYRHIRLTGLSKGNENDLVEKYYGLFSKDKSINNVPSKETTMQAINKAKVTFGDHLQNPLILTLLLYLIMSKTEEGVDILASLTSLYDNIMNALFKRLKTRIHDKRGEDIPKWKYDNYIEEIYHGLTSVALKSLSKNQIILSTDSFDEWVETASKLLGLEENCIMSTFFVCNGFINETGYETTSYSFPHKSFQEFLAAKAIYSKLKELNNSTLVDIIGKTEVITENLILFVGGICSINREDCLTTNLCKDIVCALQLKKTKYSFRDNLKVQNLLRETSYNAMLLTVLTTELESIHIDERLHSLDIFSKILMRPCPELDCVTLSIMTNGPLAMNMLGMLKEKETNLNLTFDTTDSASTFRSDDLLNCVSGGRCVLETFGGCIGLRGVNLLPNKLRILGLTVQSEEEAAAINILAKHTVCGYFKLTLENCCYCIDAIPNFTYQLLLLIEHNRQGGFEDILAILRILPIPSRARYSFRERASVHLKLNCPLGTFEELRNMCRRMREENIIVSNFSIECRNLTEDERYLLARITGEKDIGVKRGRFSAGAISGLENELSILELTISGPVEAEGLCCLMTRLTGGTNDLQPIALTNYLSLGISRTCEICYLPERFVASSSGRLWVRLLDLTENDIDWILSVLDKLPRSHELAQSGGLRVLINGVNISFPNWKRIMEKMKLKKIAVEFKCCFDHLSKEERSCFEEYRSFNIYLDDM